MLGLVKTGVKAPLAVICGYVGALSQDRSPAGVDSYDRKVQKKGNSGLFVAVPPPIAHALGIQKGRTVRFWSINGKAIFKPVSSDGLTKKDVADVDKYEEAVMEIREELKAVAGNRTRAGGRNKTKPASPEPVSAETQRSPRTKTDETRAADPEPAGKRPPMSNSERLQRLRL